MIKDVLNSFILGQKHTGVHIISANIQVFLLHTEDCASRHTCDWAGPNANSSQFYEWKCWMPVPPKIFNCWHETLQNSSLAVFIIQTHYKMAVS